MRPDGLPVTVDGYGGPRVGLIAPSQPSQNVLLKNKRLSAILGFLSQTSQRPNQDRLRRSVACQRPNLFAVLAVSRIHGTTKAAIDFDDEMFARLVLAICGTR